MGKYIAEQTIKLIIAADIPVRKARVAILGLAFKENVPDLRNTRVVDIIRELRDYGVEVRVNDPLASADEARRYYDLDLMPLEAMGAVDAVVVAVSHQAYLEGGLPAIAQLKPEGAPILIDVKGIFDPAEAGKLGIRYWRL
jgi:UDP-N-acetyl-D-galactosamine dehydrogenase